ncbi:uncharacterized protein LOC127260285 [Andrographis paniculata]|uniref:uncharacterized protein LOC127260285 n=1 Tax=Andrographis paniculata TaxID=175694 RepID=UPI0021E89FBB|nr:uncharacterized protein LOC127260285 [Andrographis paniculata]
MKREGRQHGMVRTNPILSVPSHPRPRARRVVNQLSSPPTAGVFARVPTRPTAHSKFTGKCGRPQCRDCHDHIPACKSKDKAKGAQKSRSSSDTMSSYRLIAWRVVDSAPGFRFSGLSASGVLDYLGRRDDDDDDDYHRPQIIMDDEDEAHEGPSSVISHGGTDHVEIELEADGDEGDWEWDINIIDDEDDESSWCLVEQMGLSS